jgi:hypothetical protein
MQSYYMSLDAKQQAALEAQVLVNPAVLWLARRRQQCWLRTATTLGGIETWTGAMDLCA